MTRMLPGAICVHPIHGARASCWRAHDSGMALLRRRRADTCIPQAQGRRTAGRRPIPHEDALGSFPFRPRLLLLVDRRPSRSSSRLCMTSRCGSWPHSSEISCLTRRIHPIPGSSYVMGNHPNNSKGSPGPGWTAPTKHSPGGCAETCWHSPDRRSSGKQEGASIVGGQCQVECIAGWVTWHDSPGDVNFDDLCNGWLH